MAGKRGPVLLGADHGAVFDHGLFAERQRGDADADAAAKFVAGIMPKMPNVDADTAKKTIEMVK